MEKTFTVHFNEGSHEETWKSTDFHCVKCGGKEVWEDQEYVDSYELTGYICTKCGYNFSLCNVLLSLDGSDEKRLDKLRSNDKSGFISSVDV